MPRSLTVLSVCAVAACVERTPARARVRTRDTRFMAKPFKVVRERLLPHHASSMGQPVIHRCERRPEMQFGAQSNQAMDRWPRQAPQLAATACITERLATRVKGLTSDFCVLLLTNPAQTRRPAGIRRGRRGCGRGFLVAAHA